MSSLSGGLVLLLVAVAFAEQHAGESVYPLSAAFFFFSLSYPLPTHEPYTHVEEHRFFQERPFSMAFTRNLFPSRVSGWEGEVDHHMEQLTFVCTEDVN